MGDNHRNPEAKLQDEALGWLVESCAYREIFSDREATGHRFDSIGVLAGRLVLVEVKPSLYAGMGRFDPTGPDSIESKIAGMLKPLYIRDQQRTCISANSIWNRAKPPIVAILIGRYSEAGLDELVETLRRRSTQWLFDYKVWWWSEHRLKTIAEKALPKDPHPEAYRNVCVPVLKHLHQPRSKSQQADFVRIADKYGVGSLLSESLDLARSMGFQFERNQSNINIRCCRVRGR